ncbi:MAG: hypothetical protein IVW53_07960 [Chloroflexi bacterium]|nr:hypothetical protein [Chloroflexota bacterium]
MTSDPRAFIALHVGTATSNASLIGRIDDRWRLLGSLAGPASQPVDAVVRRLAARVAAADRALGSTLGVDDPDGLARLPRITARSGAAETIAVLAATEATRLRLERAATVAGWRVTSASLERDDLLAVFRCGLSPGVTTLLAGTADPVPGPERDRAAILEALVAGIVDRRPDATVVLSGPLALAPIERRSGGAELLYAPPAVDAGSGRGSRSERNGGRPPDPLVVFLERLRSHAGDAATGIARTTQTLAEVLGIRIETLGLGMGSGLRVAARPAAHRDDGSPEIASSSHLVVVPSAGLVPRSLGDADVDEVLAWATMPFDRVRLRDRLGDLGRTPWSDADGDGAELRMAAARAALSRLGAATADRFPADPPDLIIATGGVFSMAPGPAVALAIADTIRRPGASGLALDHARLLGPLGTIDDDLERRRVVEDLVDDLLVPLGSVVAPAGLHAGRSAGRLSVRSGTGLAELDLVPGGLQLVDLPPGHVASAEFEFRDPVRLGTRGRRFSVEVAGGLGGLLVDLRDVPLRLPDRLEHRRELLAAWQRALWSGAEA